MGGCAVANCKSNTRKNKYLCNNEKLSFHKFPKNQKLAKLWWLKCRRNDRVCSLHFLPRDFDHSSPPEMYGLPAKKRLYKNVVPSLNLPTKLSSTIKRISSASIW